MTVKIAKKIVAYDVKKPGDELPDPLEEVAEARDQGTNVQFLHPPIERDEELEGTTYKIRTPLSDHALYITINDIITNRGTEYEHKRPYEIFINSKNMENFAWIVALTRVISAIFRKGGDLAFLVEELRSVFDPRGGYYKKGGKYMPSLVAEIGECIEKHLIKIGMLRTPEAAAELKAKRDKAKAQGLHGSAQCPKCSQLSMVRLDGCDTCLECGYSKCG